MIGKLWQLFGWFYISLGLAILIYPILKSRQKKILTVAGLALAIGVGSYHLGGYLLQNWNKTGRIFKGPAGVSSEVTLGQDEFLKRLVDRLPLRAEGCIFWYGDTPTVYLVSELYPRRFKTVKDEEKTTGCDYIISQGKEREEVGELILRYKNNFLYKGGGK